MARFLIELSHGDEHEACVRALHAIEQSGSHLFTNIDWGCRSGTHRGWLVVDVDSREEALRMVPPGNRHEVTIVELNRFNAKQIKRWLAQLDD